MSLTFEDCSCHLIKQLVNYNKDEKGIFSEKVSWIME